jgi:hypothetical protein
MNAIKTTIHKTLTTAVREVATKRGIADVDDLVADILLAFELGPAKPKKTEKAPSEKTESVKSEGGKKRVVSKKMKEAFMKLDGATDEKLNEVIKAYKSAAEVTSFDEFARQQLGMEVVEKPKKEAKPKKEKKEKSGRMDKWTPTSTKLFKTIVEENGGEMKDELKKEFVTWLDALSDEQFADASIQGHMRSFVMSKVVKALPRVEAGAGEGDEEEDLEEFDFEGETLLKGVTTGKIYRPTEEAGDVLIGYAGKGRFADVSK